jgi:hypothetical protein
MITLLPPKRAFVVAGLVMSGEWRMLARSRNASTLAELAPMSFPDSMIRWSRRSGVQKRSFATAIWH